MRINMHKNMTDSHSFLYGEGMAVCFCYCGCAGGRTILRDLLSR